MRPPLWTYTARIDGRLTLGEIFAGDMDEARRQIMHLLARHGRRIEITRIFEAPRRRPGAIFCEPGPCAPSEHAETA